MHDHNNKNNHGKWHWLIMALCIGGPIIGMLLLAISRAGGLAGFGFLPFLFFLLCPLSHLLMFPLMAKLMGDDKQSVEAREENDSHSHSGGCH